MVLRLDRQSAIVDTRMYNLCIQYDRVRVLRDKYRKFVGGMHVYTSHTLCDFGLFIFKTDCFIEFAANTMLNAASDGYQLVPLEVNTVCIISVL